MEMKVLSFWITIWHFYYGVRRLSVLHHCKKLSPLYLIFELLGLFVQFTGLSSITYLMG